MAGERTFTEGEAYALVADGIERETAAAKVQIDELTAQNVTLGNEKDVLTQRVTAAEEGKAAAEQAFEDYKAEQERIQASEAKRSERIAKVAEVAPALVADIDTDEEAQKRGDRIVAMSDEQFDEYVADLTAAKPQTASDDGKGGKTTPSADPTKGELPRESAAFKGGKPTSETDKPSVLGVIGARRAIRTGAKAS